MVKHKYWKELKLEALALYSKSSTDIQRGGTISSDNGGFDSNRENVSFCHPLFIVLLPHQPSPRVETEVHMFLVSHLILPVSGHNLTVKTSYMPPGTLTEMELSNAFS